MVAMVSRVLLPRQSSAFCRTPCTSRQGPQLQRQLHRPPLTRQIAVPPSTAPQVQRDFVAFLRTYLPDCLWVDNYGAMCHLRPINHRQAVQRQCRAVAVQGSVAPVHHRNQRMA